MDERRTVVVTGGGGGLGTAVAARLAKRGASVALMGRSAPPLQAAAQRLGAHAFPADVTSRDQVAAAAAAIAARLGPVTWLVNAAGIARSAPVLPPDDDLWTDTLAVNATGAWIVSTTFLPGMLEAGGGAIVNVASTAATRGFRYTAAYVASKHALLGLTRALAEDLAGKGVRVNAVCPGFLDTALTARTVESVAEKTRHAAEEVRATIGAMNARGDLVPPAEVADVILDLLADETRTGDAVVIE